MKPAWFKKRIQAFGYACKGLYSFFRYEHHAQIHLAASIFVISLGWMLSISITEWIICSFCIALVICCELINSAIERLCDWIEPQHNKHIKYVKDVSAAAVFVAAILSGIIGLLIFIPKLV